jgi:hypothetical protein
MDSLFGHVGADSTTPLRNYSGAFRGYPGGYRGVGEPRWRVPLWWYFLIFSAGLVRNCSSWRWGLLN